MPITYFNSASNPADTGTVPGPTVAVTPPANMVNGDLVVFVAHYKASTVTLAISQASGQTWNTEAQIQAGAQTYRLFWCVFNGTWGADPSVTVTSGTLALTVVMHVFRPSLPRMRWSLDSLHATGNYAAPSTPFTVTITGITTRNSEVLVIATWTAEDDTPWGSLTAGWSGAGTAQYRNGQGTDQSISTAYRIFSPPGSETGNVSQNQSLGGDAGCTGIISFHEMEIQFNNYQFNQVGARP